MSHEPTQTREKDKDCPVGKSCLKQTVDKERPRRWLRGAERGTTASSLLPSSFRSWRSLVPGPVTPYEQFHVLRRPEPTAAVVSEANGSTVSLTFIDSSLFRPPQRPPPRDPYPSVTSSTAGNLPLLLYTALPSGICSSAILVTSSQTPKSSWLSGEIHEPKHISEEQSQEHSRA